MSKNCRQRLTEGSPATTRSRGQGCTPPRLGEGATTLQAPDPGRSRAKHGARRRGREPARHSPTSSLRHKGRLSSRKPLKKLQFPRVGAEQTVSRAQSRCSDALHIKDATASSAENTVRQRRPAAQARRATIRALRTCPSPPFQRPGELPQPAGATTERGGRGEKKKKPVPFIVRANRPAPHGARARPTLTLAHARAEPAALSGAHALGRRRWLSLRLFFCWFPEKFLERRRPGEAGGWESQGSERLRESERSKTHRHPPASIHHGVATAKPKTTETLKRGGESMGTAADAPSSACA